MALDRQAKAFFAVLTLIAAVFLLMNHIVAEDPVEDWLLAGGLLLLSAIFWVWLWLDYQAESETALTVSGGSEDQIPRAQEWIISSNAVSDMPVDTPAPDIDKTDEVAPTPAPDMDKDVREEVIEEVVENGDQAEVVEAAKDGDPIAEAAVGEATAAPPKGETEAAPERESPPATEPTPAPAAVEADDEPDDLTRVEGIGPKYRDALIDAGISQFDQLATLTLEQIEQIAKDAGMRRAASMETWAQQAELAAKGEWEALDKLQEELSGGRR